MDQIDYLKRRERQERAAAKRAASASARAAHQEMAQTYARLVDQACSHEPSLGPARQQPIAA